MEIVILLIVLNVLEAIHDSYVIKGKFSKYNSFKWHQWSFIHYVTLTVGVLYIAYGVNGAFLLGLIYAATVRVSIFNTVLNRLRGLTLFHLGDQGVDGFVQRRRCFWIFRRKVCFTIRKEVYYLAAFALASLSGTLLCC